MPLHHKKAGLSGGDDRRSLNVALNEVEPVLSREKRRRRILHGRQTHCVSLAEAAVILFSNRKIILKSIDKPYMKWFSEPAFRLACFIAIGFLPQASTGSWGRGMTLSATPQNTDSIHRIAADLYNLHPSPKSRAATGVRSLFGAL
jgi:hypothetical protein